MSGPSRRIWAPPRWAIWALFILLLLAPLLIRTLHGTEPIPLDESYEHLNRAQLISQGKVPVSHPYDALLALFLWTGVPWILPFLLGLLSFALIACILPRIMIKHDRRIERYALLLVAITPLTISVFTTYNSLSLFFLVFLIGLNAFLTKRTLFAALCFIALPLIRPEGLIISALFIIFSLLRKRERFAITTTIGLTCVLILIGFRWEASWPIHSPFFGEFGAYFGFSLFVLLLAAITILSDWRGLDKQYTGAFILLMLLSYQFPGLRSVALIPLVLYAAHALSLLATRQWALPFLRQASFLLLACLSLFVILSQQQLLITATPEPELAAIADRLSTMAERGTVLAPAEYDGFISHAAGRQVILPDERIYQAITITEAGPWLRERNVRFILVTPLMRDQFWQRPDEGLLFLLDHNAKFVRATEEDDHVLWLFLQEYAG